MRKIEKFLASSCIAIAAMTAAPALAQDADQADTETTAPTGGLDEIIVTAQRRAESLQDAAIAIDAVGGDDLITKGITQADALTKTAPSLTVTNGGGSNTSIFVRGVGNVTTSSYNDPAVTPSYDGVVLGRAAGAFGAAFYDLARVEVLKGPQGILYGRNATGGAVNIIPNPPEIGVNAGGFTVSAGNYDAVEAQGYLNLGVTENSALRISGTRQVHDGYNRDGSDDLDRSGLRAQFLIEPTADLSVRVGADYTKIGGVGPGASYVGNFTPTATGFAFTDAGFDSSEGLNTDAANAYRQTSLGAPGFGFLDPINSQQSIDSEVWGVNAEIEYNLGFAALTVIPAYREVETTSFFYGPAFNTANTNEKDTQFSMEARLAGDVGMFEYVVGGFYFDESIEATNEYNQEFVLPIQDYEHNTKSWAAFGQLTANITDEFRLVGGLRYTKDKKRIDGVINNFITFCGGIPPVTPPASFAAGCAADGALPHYPNYTDVTQTVEWLVANGWIADGSTNVDGTTQVFPLTTGAGVILKTDNPVVDSGTYSKATWKAGAEYDLAPDSLLYASVESGYRAGGFQLAEGNSSYDPETITAYTIGSKNRFFGNTVQLNLEGFWWKYKDQQISYFTVSPDGVLVNSIDNAGRAEIKGVDVDLMVKPFANTTLNAKVQYLDAKYKELTLTTAPPRNNFNCDGGPNGETLSDGTPVFEFDCSGKPLLYSPKWTVNFGIEQVVPISSDMDLIASVSTAWRDSAYGAFEYLDFEKIPSYFTTDADVTLKHYDGFSVGVFVRNIEDERRVQTPQSSPIGFAVARYTAPRTYGIRISGEF